MSPPADDMPRPTMPRRIWTPGLLFPGETPEQAAEREQRCREEDARIEAEVARLWAWKQRPWWEDPPPA